MTYTRTDRLCLVVNFEYLSFLGEGGVIDLKDGKIEERAAGGQAHFKLKPPVH